MDLIIRAVACGADNYAYVVRRQGRADAVVVDATAAEPVAKALDQDQLSLAAILCTHHHYDHVGGNEALLRRFAAAQVYAHRGDRGRVPAQTDDLDDGQSFEVGGLSVQAHHVPGHTAGAVAYAIDDALFTGDTLFVAGCGRLFEGTAAEMHASLMKLAALPPDTRVFCGHEYTDTNLRFAATVEPDNAAVQRKLEWVAARIDADRPTVPSTLREELATNPFLRCAAPSVVERYGPGSPAEVFAAVRRAKDRF